METSHCRSCACKQFSPQYWKDNKCRDCFHLILDHTSTADSSGDDLKRSDLLSKDGNGTNGSSSKDSKRDRIAKEILQTEKTYVENLITMIECFLIPLRALHQEIAPKEQISTIFSNIEDIRLINQTLLDGLLERIDDGKWTPTQKIGDVFGRLIPFLKTYTNYTAGYASSIAALNECEKNTVFATMVKKFGQTERCKHLDLRSYLIQPVQRIPRYNLLLDDFLKHTEETHPDFLDLQHALSKMKEVANVINEAIRINENRIKVVEIQTSFISPIQDINLVEPHRMFVREGSLTKVCRKENKKFKFVLFSDILIYGSHLPGDKYLFHRSVSLESCRTEGLVDTDQIQNAFVIGSAKKSFIIIAENQTQKDVWMGDIQDQMKILIAKRESFGGVQGKALEQHAEAPIWIPDHISPTCLLCKDEFGFFVRRHHCRACGTVVCSKCSEHRVMIPSIDTKSDVRVCDKCFKDKPKETRMIRSHSHSVMILQ